jgi:hypothetical protein
MKTLFVVDSLDRITRDRIDLFRKAKAEVHVYDLSEMRGPTDPHDSLFGDYLGYENAGPNPVMASLLHRAVLKINPDCLHSVGFGTASNLVLSLKTNLKSAIPLWLVSPHTPALSVLLKLRTMAPQVRLILRSCDEFVDHFSPSFSIKKAIKTNHRKFIVINGCDDSYNRTWTALEALKFCKLELRNRAAFVMDANSTDRVGIEVFSRREKIPILTGNQERHSRALISIDLSIAESSSGFVLDAMASGSVPIHGDSEWARNLAKAGGMTLFVDPNDPRSVARAIRRSLSKRSWLNAAAKTNWNLLKAEIKRQSASLF